MIGREIQVTLGQPLSFLQQQEHQVIITAGHCLYLVWPAYRLKKWTSICD